MSGAPVLLLNVADASGRTPASQSAAQAVESGFDGVGFVDSPRLYPDPVVETASALAGAQVSLAGPCVASLGLRHPATVAGALRTLERRHPGRAFTVVGRGESSVRNEGLPVPSLQAYTDSLGRLRELVAAGGESEPTGRLLGAASGPRVITQTVDALGAVLLDVGAQSDVVRRAVDLARRDEPGGTVWLFLRAVVTTSEEQADEAAEPVLGSCAARLVASPEWYGVDDARLPAVRAVAESHDYARHGTAGARGGVRTPADREVRDRFVLSGSADDIEARLRPLAPLGVQGVVVAGGMRGVTARLPELAAALRRGLDGSVAG